MSFFVLIIGSFIGLRKDKKFVLSILGLSFLSVLTLIISGQYFPYHFLGFFTFSFIPIVYLFEKNEFGSTSLFSLLLLSVLIIGHVPKETLSFLQNEKPFIVRNGKVDKLVDVLRKIIKKMTVFKFLTG